MVRAFAHDDPRIAIVGGEGFVGRGVGRLMPFAHDQEYEWTLLQSVAGDAHLVSALVLIQVLNSEARMR